MGEIPMKHGIPVVNIRLRWRYAIFFLIFLLSLGGLVSCSASKRNAEIPIVPLASVEEVGGVLPMRPNLQVRDQRFQITQYSLQGKRSLVTVDANLFPTDVIVVKDPVSSSLKVFLARSPHGGCLLSWVPEKEFFEDPCYGSRFDSSGGYLSGPSVRDMDRLPARLEADMILVAPEIIYGQSHP
jgi:hypothetical protein